MSNVKSISATLARMSAPHLADNQAVVFPTHCLYPSSAAVTVSVFGGKSQVVVTDGGGAISELRSHNREVSNPDRFLTRFCRDKGLIARQGQIMSQMLEPDQLEAAIVMVANASASAARVGFDKFKPKVKRDLKGALHAVLDDVFQGEAIKREGRLTGKSTRSYVFDSLISLDGGRILAVDAVFKDTSSINARTIAHLDVKNTGDESIIQSIVYDDSDQWEASNLNLMRMAAPLLPFSNAREQFGDRFKMRRKFTNQLNA